MSDKQMMKIDSMEIVMKEQNEDDYKMMMHQDEAEFTRFRAERWGFLQDNLKNYVDFRFNNLINECEQTNIVANLKAALSEMNDEFKENLVVLSELSQKLACLEQETNDNFSLDEELAVLADLETEFLRIPELYGEEVMKEKMRIAEESLSSLKAEMKATEITLKKEVEETAILVAENATTIEDVGKLLHIAKEQENFFERKKEQVDIAMNSLKEVEKNIINVKKEEHAFVEILGEQLELSDDETANNAKASAGAPPQE